MGSHPRKRQSQPPAAHGAAVRFKHRQAGGHPFVCKHVHRSTFSPAGAGMFQNGHLHDALSAGRRRYCRLLAPTCHAAMGAAVSNEHSTGDHFRRQGLRARGQSDDRAWTTCVHWRTDQRVPTKTRLGRRPSMHRQRVGRQPSSRLPLDVLPPSTHGVYTVTTRIHLRTRRLPSRVPTL